MFFDLTSRRWILFRDALSDGSPSVIQIYLEDGTLFWSQCDVADVSEGYVVPVLDGSTLQLGFRDIRLLRNFRSKNISDISLSPLQTRLQAYGPQFASASGVDVTFPHRMYAHSTGRTLIVHHLAIKNPQSIPSVEFLRLSLDGSSVRSLLCLSKHAPHFDYGSCYDSVGKGRYLVSSFSTFARRQIVYSTWEDESSDAIKTVEGPVWAGASSGTVSSEGYHFVLRIGDSETMTLSVYSMRTGKEIRKWSLKGFGSRELVLGMRLERNDTALLIHCTSRDGLHCKFYLLHGLL